LIEDAYRTGEATGLPVWGTDQAGPFQTVPHPGPSWRPEGQPARQPHENLRHGTAKILTLFHPADGQVRVEGVTSCPNTVLHGWLKTELTAVLAAMPAAKSSPTPRGDWERWQQGLSIKPTLLEELPPLRMLPVLDNLAGHKTPGFVRRLVRARDHAAVHVGGWLVVEQGREHSRDPQASRVGWPASDDGGSDHGVVRGGGAALERGPNIV
jgi:hypothetical protein